MYVCIYTAHPTCIEIAGALNPGSGHEIVIPERLTLLPHLAGPRGRAWKSGKSAVETGRDGWDARGSTERPWKRTGGVEESGICPETRGFRGSREGLRRLIDCKTHGMNHTSYWDGIAVRFAGTKSLLVNVAYPRQCTLRSRINVKNYKAWEKLTYHDLNHV